MSHFTALGYSTTGHAGVRAAARGVLEVDAFTPAYELPYLGTGEATRAVARGVLELPQTWLSVALGKMRVVEPDVAGMRFVFPRVVPARFPPRETLVGHVTLRHGFAPNFVATPHSVQGARLGRTVPPPVDWLRGHARLGKGISEDIVPPPFLPPRQRRGIPPKFPLQVLQGRAVFSLNRPEPIYPVPMSLIGPRVVQPPRFPIEILRGRHQWITAHKTRASTELALLAEIDISIDAELALRGDLDVFASDTYRVIIRDLSTGAEMELGQGSSLTGIGIADGHYALRIEVDGRYWEHARFRTEYPFTIVGGELAVTLPAVVGLRAQLSGTSVDVTWRIEPLLSATAPGEFALWTGATSPVDTSGAPLAIAGWSGVGGYFTSLTATPTLLFVAVAARLAAQVGPVSQVQVTGEGEAALAAPRGVSGRIPDGDWA